MVEASSVVQRALALRERAERRFRPSMWPSLLRGLWVRRHFRAAGVVRVAGGGPLPQIDNQGGTIDVGNCSFFPGVRLECWADARIRIGSGTYLNRNVEIVAAQSVSIGRDCKIARDVIVMDTDQHEVPGIGLVVAPVEIGDRVWIGARAMILKGVTVGHDAVIAAGAIVTRDVPPRTIVAGVPAKIVRKF